MAVFGMLANLRDSSGYMRRCQGFVIPKADHQRGKPAQMKLYRESEIAPTVVDYQWLCGTMPPMIISCPERLMPAN